jgi:predicted acyl esterase
VPTADATITSVFNGTATPMPCVVQADGVRLCDETAFVPARSRSTVRTFDNVPIDVRVAFPPKPTSGGDGPYPLILDFHRYADAKLPLQGLSGWLSLGYATFTMTDRGFGESCGTEAARQADPNGCARGYVHMMDTRYEVRDAQELVARLVDDGLVDRQRIGAVGFSYGGATSLALAALKDRKMLPDGTLVPWTSASGARIAIAAAAPATGWTDLAATFAPNGTTLDYVEDARYRGRTGVLKESWEKYLYTIGSYFYYAQPGADLSADLPGWHILLNHGDPYEDTHGNALPAVATMREEMAAHHSAYYIDDSEAPAPLLIANGWTDDLFPADEAIRLYNRTRTRYPGAPVSLFLSDVGHGRSQHKEADVALLAAVQLAWMNYYVKGAGNPPFRGVETLTQTCPYSAASGGPYYAGNWAAAAPGEVRIDGPVRKRISPSAGSLAAARMFDPVSGGDACATVPATDQPGTATYRSAPVPAGGFTLAGSPTVVADITSRGATSQIAARLLDVDAAAGNQTLIARGLWRPAVANGPVRQVFQLHPNAYRFAPGHVVKLELLPNDNPSYGRVSDGQAEIRLSNLELRLPALDQPGSSNGLVQSPAPKIVPPGYTLARDFMPAAGLRLQQARRVALSGVRFRRNMRALRLFRR